jgi:diguanylate cyclase (GGDEF)-like protein
MDVFRVYDLNGYLEGLNRLFDVVRIVNPISKKVIYQNGEGETIIHGDDCYEFWEKGKVCDNCISARAFTERKSFTKIEYKGDGIYMVMASPIIFGDDMYILEILKDLTETGIVTGLSGLSLKESTDIIAKLNEKVMKDDLTGAYNRRYINEKLPSDIFYAARSNEKISVIMLDIDYFKEINDIYGHLAGDLVLKEVTSIIKSKIRRNYDWVARYGGDEFLIVLKNSDKKASDMIIKEIQMALRNKVIKFDNYTIGLTLSFGTYIVEPGTKDFDEVLYIVDNNLNMAKEYGKDKVISS